MSNIVGEAFVIVRPDVSHFRRDVAIGVTTATPGGTGVPVPVVPTIPAAARRRFFGEVGALRGALLGLGEGVGARALGISAAAGGVFLFGKAALGAVKSAATLEQELNVFEQVSGATADQMARVREEARRLGADIQLPAVSAGDAAATMTELAKAGLTVDEVLQGTRGTLQLATAANLDFATSAELAAGALNAFELPGTQAVKVADLLAGAANAAQGDIADFGLGLSQVAAVAHQAGLSVQETVTFLTEFAKAGIQGSDAGTSLRVALLRLIAPTDEAKDIFHELGVDLQGFQAGRIRAPEFFLQLQKAMAPLSRETRNAALATIFGTDAIRVASIAVKDAGADWNALAQSVNAAGQAQGIADARTKGLSGKVSGLSSNLETLGTTIGTAALPLLSDFIDKLNAGVSAANTFAEAVGDLSHDIADLDLGPFGKVGDAFGVLVDAIGKGETPGTAALERFRKEIEKPIRAGRIIEPPGGSALTRLITGTFERTGEDVALRGAAARAGKAVGESFGKAVEDAITDEEQGVIDAAKRTVQDAQTALRNVVAEGARAVEAAAIDAKQNLATIGQNLAAQVTQLLDSGPLAQRIQRLQDQLDRSREGLERGNLARALRDAQDELARAEAQLAGGAPKTEAQKAGEEQFLRPFKERVKDAQAALAEFNTQGNIDKLRARLDAQKARLQRTLDDLIARFNAGLLSGTAVNAQVAALLQKNVGPMRLAGTAQGFAFRQAFAAQLAGLQAQVAAIIGGPGTTTTGAEPQIVRPADVAKTAAGNVAAAQRSVKDAIVNLQKAQEKAVEGADGTNEILRDIRRELRGGSPAKPSGDVATPPKPRPRIGGRR